MFNKIKNYVSDNTGFLLRLDDIAENMNWDMMEQATNLFDKFGVKPVLGIIPNNKDPELLSYPKKKANFWETVRTWEKKGWEIGMHGNNHVYDKFCKKNDYLGYGGNTEFCGHKYQNQFEKIKNGLDKFNSENLNVRTFFAPNQISKTETSYEIDENVDGTTDYRFSNPDFSVVQLRTNLVVRWEYVPGSELFFVWSQGANGNNDPDNTLFNALDNQVIQKQLNNTFLIKATYRFLL